MAQLDDAAAREVAWYRELIDGSGPAKGLDKDLRDVLVSLTRDRATSEALWARQGESGDADAPPAPPTVSDVRVNHRHVLRGSDVVITWEGLTPPGSRVTVLAPDGSEQIVRSGNSAAMRVAVSGSITLRLNHQGRIMDVPAGNVECYELPQFSIPRGVLPPVPKPTLPQVQIPEHSVEAIQVPVPRLSSGSVAHLQRQIGDSAPRATGAAIDIMRLVRAAFEAGRAPLDSVRDTLRTQQTRKSPHG